jgi:hypothetical protein
MSCKYCDTNSPVFNFKCPECCARFIIKQPTDHQQFWMESWSLRFSGEEMAHIKAAVVLAKQQMSEEGSA